MALVGYSDSEDSGDDQTVPSSKVDAVRTFERTTSKKIKVDLSALTAKPDDTSIEQPAAKRQRTAGAFSGFNSLLPAPKRTVSSGLKKGISLKTSSEAAFSRAPAQSQETPSTYDEELPTVPSIDDAEQPAPPAEVKVVGKATRFVPLSVANARKKKPVIPPVKSVEQPQSREIPEGDVVTTKPSTNTQNVTVKPKRSLFAVEPAEASSTAASAESYEPEFISVMPDPAGLQDQMADHSLAANTSAIQTITSDFNLSASEQRRMFGRDVKRNDLKITHFNMDAEYKANQEIAAKGELVEHRAVRAIAPGKHSLQQLVNNVKSQTDAIEDKWAEGKRNRSEAGNKYGW